MTNNIFYIRIKNRDYTDYEFFARNHENAQLDVHPVEEKLFDGDMFTLDENHEVTINQSAIRNEKCIPGVLVLQQNKTYGRTNNNKKRLLYQCIPHDTRLPPFVVPYEVTLEFSKCLSNKYVLFTFQQWTQKHPEGRLVETIGDVTDMNALCEYELHSHRLQHSMKPIMNHMKTKRLTHDEFIDQIVHDKKYLLQHKTEQYVFSIDPAGSLDFDDAFAVQAHDDGSTTVTVHIANVAVWLEHLQLWGYLTDRVSTVYFPHCKKPMLPAILSEQLCSLRQKQTNITMFIEFSVSNKGVVDMENVKFGNSLVKVCKNFEYEEQKLMKNTHYQHLFETSTRIDASIHDSHDVVSFWMIQVNTYLAQKLHSHDIGILRTSSLKYNDRLSFDFDKQTCDSIFHYKNASTNYVAAHNTENQKHTIMNKDVYTHITSPIRRSVDLINQLILLYRFQHLMGISVMAQKYLVDWVGKLDMINEDSKKTKQVQNRIRLLDTCSKDESLVDAELKSVVVDKKNIDSLYQYTLYIPELQVFLPANSDKELDEYTICYSKLFIFEDENHIRNKIKIQII